MLCIAECPKSVRVCARAVVAWGMRCAVPRPGLPAVLFFVRVNQVLVRLWARAAKASSVNRVFMAIAAAPLFSRLV